MIAQKRLIWLVAAGTLFTFACLPSPAAFTPSAAPVSPSDGSVTPGVPSTAGQTTDDSSAQSAKTPDSAPQAAQDTGLSAIVARHGAPSGPEPWLVFAAAASQDAPETLWAVRADGTQVKHLTDDRVWIFSVQPQASDGTTRVAYITSADGSDPLTDLTLKMVSLPDGQAETITPLGSADMTYPNRANVSDAITFAGSVAWSPDGRWIAFVGAMDGPSADVYSYEVSTGKIRQLTSGADQAFQLLWSPDSKWILHTAQKEFARSGGAFEVATGIWAAAPDGSVVNKLEDARASEFLGWVDANTLAVDGGPGMGPGGDLRLLNIAGGGITELPPSCYDGGFAYSPQHRVYLVDLTTDFVSVCPNAGDWKPGLYLVKDGARTLIPDLDVFDFKWSPVFDVFFATQKDDTLIAISPSGEALPDFAGKVPSLSIAATVDGSALAWFDGSSIYMALGPDYQPVQISGEFHSRWEALAWSR